MKHRIISMLLLLCMVPGFFITSAAMDGDIPYTDVKSKSWFYEDIKYTYSAGLMNGMSKTSFEPYKAMSRAMFITVLGRLHGAAEEETNIFPDVKNNSWYSGYVGWAVNTEVIKGFEDGTFRPDASITREEAATAISRYITYTGVILSDSDASPEFYKDEEQIQDWAAFHVDKVSLSGILRGDERGSFCPQDNLTRAEAAAIFARMHEIIKKENTAVGIVSAYDIINSPEIFISNMTSELDSSGEYPEIDLTPYKTNSAPWYFGTEFKDSGISEGALGFVKLCYKASTESTPKLIVESPAKKVELSPVSIDTKDGYTTVLFNTKDAVLQIKEANLTAANPYNYNWSEDGVRETLRDMSMRSLTGRYLRVALYPFGEETSPEGSLRYMAFFADKNAAESFNESTAGDLLKSGTDEYAEVNWNLLTDDISEKYNGEVEARRDEILKTPSAISPEDIEGNCYYISSIHGDDSNSGDSPDSPWRTISKLFKIRPNGLMTSNLKEGDAVFFERGSVFYPEFDTNYSGVYTLIFSSGVTYSAYGKGEKPIFTTAIDINGSMDWVKTDYENIWRLEKRFPVKENAPAYYDVGNIVFNDGEGWGIKVLPKVPADPYAEGSVTVDNGVVTNGYEIFDSCSVPCENPSVLKHNLEFFGDFTDGSLYLYFDKGNPGKYFDNIIISMLGEIATGGPKSDTATILDNLSFKYTGGGGVATSDGRNFIIQNCTIEWIGGGLQGGDGTVTTRYGNGYQNWADCDNIIFRNNYVNQVYDGGISTQWENGNKDAVCAMNRFSVTDCVVTNTNSHIELWNYAHKSPDNTSMFNISIKNNYLVNGGYHFGHQRPKKCGSLCYLGRFPGQTYENSVVENNVFINGMTIYCGRPLLCRGDTNGTLLRNNTYIASCDAMTYGEFSTDLRNDTIVGDVRDVPPVKYTKEAIESLRALGIDRGSTFYYFDGYLYPEEADGLYH